MKDMFEQIRCDKEFNLETVSYEEIFEGIKFGIAQAINVISQREIDLNCLRLNIQRCRTKLAYAEDMNLYPKIYLDLVGEYSVILTPFEIELLEIKHSVKTYSNNTLSESFYEFMCETFPTCDYKKIYEKYQINVEKLKKQHEKLTFY